MSAFALLAQMGPAKVRQLSEAAEGQQLTLDVPKLAARMAADLGITADDLATVLANAVLPLNELYRRSTLSPEEFVNDLSSAVKEQAPESWKDEEFENWEAIVETLPTLFARDRFFGLTAKATQLLYNRPSVLTDFTILTELRPVFDGSVSAIRALILTNTLVLGYIESDTSKTIHLSIDSEDLEQMYKAYQRAKQKNRLVLQRAADWSGVTVLPELEASESE